MAALSDLEDPDFQASFSKLEREQALFIEKQSEFLGEDYVWSRDPLHTWSRVWEYPYVYDHFKQLAAPVKAGPQRVIADIGSGVTFFPFALAKLGYQVRCTDIDPVNEAGLRKAVKVVDHAPGQVDFALCDKDRLPFADASLDAAYCVSVLEHIPDPRGTVAETFRILKPGAWLVLTIDLDLRGDAEIGIAGYRQLRQCLLEHYDLVYPETITHPRDLLRSDAGPYPARREDKFVRLRHETKEYLRGLMGKPVRPYLPFLLAVAGFVLRRKN